MMLQSLDDCKINTIVVNQEREYSRSTLVAWVDEKNPRKKNSGKI